jgi:hypothetical protein
MVSTRKIGDREKVGVVLVTRNLLTFIALQKSRPYSWRRATIGSTRMARRVGT